ncbi:hypothetical protein NPIL_235701 [Nephila pilipes]|uniref:Uncharacterized protein n=1 Tax=Nephila pilipes TaxID=299642 RepID=A0A8X6K582_NEPPI|nr:hypothetical protein NPIL_235701 [Nephila pilipes]
MLIHLAPLTVTTTSSSREELRQDADIHLLRITLLRHFGTPPLCPPPGKDFGKQGGGLLFTLLFSLQRELSHHSLSLAHFLRHNSVPSSLSWSGNEISHHSFEENSWKS